ncbi:hypothetical protein DB29_01629 [Shouchella clausii]|nr:hypothetical protein DB29_01629 [Shouchella clausii]
MYKALKETSYEGLACEKRQLDSLNSQLTKAIDKYRFTCYYQL